MLSLWAPPKRSLNLHVLCLAVHLAAAGANLNAATVDTLPRASVARSLGLPLEARSRWQASEGWWAHQV